MSYEKKKMRVAGDRVLDLVNEYRSGKHQDESGRDKSLRRQSPAGLRKLEWGFSLAAQARLLLGEYMLLSAAERMWRGGEKVVVKERRVVVELRRKEQPPRKKRPLRKKKPPRKKL